MRGPVDSGLYEANRGREQAVLILAEAHLTADAVILYQELIDHDEFGVALDIMLSDLIEMDEYLPGGLVREFESTSHILYPGENVEDRLKALRHLANEDGSESDLDSDSFV